MGADSISRQGRQRARRNERGTFDWSTSIAATSTETLVISLNESSYREGDLILYNDEGLTDVDRRRLHMRATFGRSLNHASSDAGHYDGSDGYTQGFIYERDSRLSDDDFSDANAAIRIVSVQIVGATIELVAENTSGSAESINVHGWWEVNR